MNKVFMINADQCYRQAEHKAAQYFNLLYQQAVSQSYITTLTEDFRLWKIKHIHHPTFFSYFTRKKRKPSQKDYHQYIKWLDYTNKLENYLDRSISYLFLRDLGKTLDSSETKNQIDRLVERLKIQLKDSTKLENNEIFTLASLYRNAQEEGVESSMIWLINKLTAVASNIPKGLDAVNAQRKLIKIIAGVMMHTIDLLSADISSEERSKKLDEAIRLGYCYGLTYPFIDDLLDSNVLSITEKEQYAELIRTSLITGNVPDLGGDWRSDSLVFMRYIHSELRQAFDYIKLYQKPSDIRNFFEQAYIFFNSQEIDRKKDLSNDKYTNEEIYIPIIIKSSSSRLIARLVTSTSSDDGFEKRTFLYGIYNQLADDFSDMFDDMKNGAVTPYTYYLTHHEKRRDLINPFELYWTVISHLIHHVYQSDKKTSEVILNRAINGLKRFKQNNEDKKFKQVMDVLTSGIPQFNKVLQKMVDNADDIDFFDKLLRDQIISMLKTEREEQQQFKETIKIVRQQINRHLAIFNDEKLVIKESITDAANYSLSGEGKRLRPIITWFMGVKVYGLKESTLFPLLKALEYMHTASLIFDDLPSQDNASIRRGRPTVHKAYNVAVAELTGLYLTQKAIEEQTSLEEYDTKTVLKLIRYTAQITAEMCKGQAMDLNSKGKNLTLEQLNSMCFYKTGLGFEAALLIPAILANADAKEIQALKTFARHAGIAFQIKDDLLDYEGDSSQLGKPIGIDVQNNSSTFVTVLGIEEAKKEMWEHYCLAAETFEIIPRNTSFLKHFLNYAVNRNY
ncbi:polyprenyl synthetase family protein [Lysinibacillus telephonicus]|uniref:polyprenyl synthetase family protein n=1 Tax=Lysinibacillus telephonicus TaxID=1714840 RepID=UPI0031FD4062